MELRHRPDVLQFLHTNRRWLKSLRQVGLTINSPLTVRPAGSANTFHHHWQASHATLLEVGITLEGKVTSGGVGHLATMGNSNTTAQRIQF
jgi:hypothetical protein